MKKIKNKGFTMVELIIVIAIIAILAAILAPQYLRFVEDARKTSDLQIAASYIDAVQVLTIDRNIGTHTATNEWFAFKWGKSTGPSGGMNAHMGVATVDANGIPNGYDTGKRDAVLQNEVGRILGWADSAGNLDPTSIPEQQSSAAQKQTLWFYLNLRTGEIYIDGDSSIWVSEIGLNYPLTT